MYYIFVQSAKVAYLRRKKLIYKVLKCGLRRVINVAKH